MKAIGERIRQAREHRGLSGEELALKVGYKTQSGISNLENRSNGNGGSKLPAIAQVLDFSLQWFLQGPDTDDMSKVPPYTYANRAQDLHPSQNVERTGEREAVPYTTTRQKAHELLNSISEPGLVIAVEVLEGLASRHPINKGDGAGLSVPAQEKLVA